MRRKYSFILLLFIFGQLSVSFAFNDPEYKAKKSKYYRYQCISFVVLDWKLPKSRKDKRDVLNPIPSGELIKIAPEIAGYAIPDAMYSKTWGDQIYFQYTDKCENKREITEKLMAYIASRIKGFPRYIVTDAIIHPHPHSICNEGSKWKDKGCL